MGIQLLNLRALHLCEVIRLERCLNMAAEHRAISNLASYAESAGCLSSVGQSDGSSILESAMGEGSLKAERDTSWS